MADDKPKFDHNTLLALEHREKEYSITDPSTKGLQLRIRVKKPDSKAAGGKNWIFSYSLNGKRHNVSLGGFPGVTIQAARKQAAVLRGQVSLNKLDSNAAHPAKRIREGKKQAKIEQQKDTNTVAHLIEQYHEHHLVKKTRKPEPILKRMERHIGDVIGTRPVADLTRPELNNVVKAAGKRVLKLGRGGDGYNTQRTCARDIETLMRWAVGFGMIEASPAVGLAEMHQYKAPVRKRTLLDHEIQELWTGAGTELGRKVHNLFKLQLVTGCRINEVAGLKWSDIDFDDRTILLRETKASRKDAIVDYTIPMNSLAEQILRDQHNQTGHRTHVFASKVKGQHITQQGANAKLNRLIKRHGFEKWISHDHRRTMRTRLSDIKGISRDAAELLIGHTINNQVQRAYDHHNYLPQMREAADLWGEVLQGIISGNVVSIGEGKRA